MIISGDADRMLNVKYMCSDRYNIVNAKIDLVVNYTVTVHLLKSFCDIFLIEKYNTTAN